jgi:hypothetical protein
MKGCDACSAGNLCSSSRLDDNASLHLARQIVLMSSVVADGWGMSYLQSGASPASPKYGIVQMIVLCRVLRSALPRSVVQQSLS